MSHRLFTGFFVAAALLLGSMTSGSAASVADFYRSKTVKIVVSFGAGGTYGLYARLVSQHWPKHIPGSPTIVVQHMPGAGGLKAANFVYNASPKDGTEIGMLVDTMVISQLLRPKRVRFDATKFQFLGSAVGTPHVIAVRKDSGVTSLADMKKKVVKLGSTGTGSPTFLLPTIVGALIGTKAKIIKGYKGSRAIVVAIERGEVQGMSLAWISWVAQKSAWFKSGFMVPIITVGMKREPDLPNIPSLVELTKTQADRDIATFMSSYAVMGRSFTFPPGVPKDRVKALRVAFDKMVKDPAFLADAKKRNVPVSPKTGQELEAFIAKAMKIDAKLVARTRKAVFGK